MSRCSHIRKCNHVARLRGQCPVPLLAPQAVAKTSCHFSCHCTHAYYGNILCKGLRDSQWWSRKKIYLAGWLPASRCQWFYHRASFATSLSSYDPLLWCVKYPYNPHNNRCSLDREKSDIYAPHLRATSGAGLLHVCLSIRIPPQ